MRNNGMAAAECEFVFMLGKSLQPRAVPYTREEVMDAVASLHPGLELPDSRFTDFSAAGAPSLVADNACAHWMVLGEPTSASWRDADLAAHTSFWSTTKRQPQATVAMPDPRDAQLAGECADGWERTEAGQFAHWRDWCAYAGGGWTVTPDLGTAPG